MTIAQLKTRYFLDKEHFLNKKENTFEKDSSVTPLIDMKEYMKELLTEIKKLKKGDFLYICGWLFSWIGTNPQWGFFGYSEKTHGPGNKKFTDLLIAKAKAGVDVRVLGWVSYAGMGGVKYDPVLFRMPMPPIGAPSPPGITAKTVQGYYNIANLNAITMNSIRILRTEPKMANKAVLNMLSHPAGSVHVKMVVLGNTQAIGFTGGLDLSQWRWAEFGHVDCPNKNLPNIIESLDWHDIQAKVKGKAVQAFYDLFRDMWDEGLKRTPYLFRLFKTSKVRYNFTIVSHYKGTTKPVPERILSPLPQGTSTQYIQSLRTIPTFNFKLLNRLPEGKPFSKAPKGLFELKAAWKKAILGAKDYIYIEDNSLMSQEVLLWINQAIKNNPNLLVILLKGAGVDPADPVLEDKKSKVIIDYTINKGLCKGITTNQSKLNQIRVYQAWGTTVNVCNKLSNHKKTQPMPLKKITSISSTESEVVTGWLLEDNLAKKIKDIAATKDIKELKKNVLRKKVQLRIVGGLSYPVVGNPLVKRNQHIVLRIKHGNTQPPLNKNGTLHITFGIYMHAKTTIIDDNWAMIGSNNVWRRSLYTDWEHVVSFIDDGGETVKKYRAKLWAEHFMVGTPHSQLPNNFFKTATLENALSVWFLGSNFPKRANNDPGPDYLRSVALPINIPGPKPDKSTVEDVMKGLDETFDPDSRKPWGALLYPSTIW